MAGKAAAEAAKLKEEKACLETESSEAQKHAAQYKAETEAEAARTTVIEFKGLCINRERFIVCSTRHKWSSKTTKSRG